MRTEEQRRGWDDRTRSEIVHWLDGLAPWGLWFTGTFEGEYTEAATQRAFERFMRRELRRLSWFYVTERNPSRAGHHVHALMAEPTGRQVNRRQVWSRWFKRFGRNRLEPIMQKPNVEEYCTKHLRQYLIKGDGWYNFEINSSDLWHCCRVETRIQAPAGVATEAPSLSVREGEAPAGATRTTVAGGIPPVGVRELASGQPPTLVGGLSRGSGGMGATGQPFPQAHRGQPSND